MEGGCRRITSSPRLSHPLTIPYCLAHAGKHTGPEHAARCELEEEARLVGGRWVPLLAAGGSAGGDEPSSSQASVAHDKYSTNRFFAYLAIDCEPVSEDEARPRDAEEVIHIDREVPLPRLLELLRRGSLNVPSSYTVLMAMDRLREMRML